MWIRCCKNTVKCSQSVTLLAVKNVSPATPQRMARGRLVGIGAWPGLNVAQARTAGWLGTLHAPALISAGERLDVATATLAVNEATEPLP